MKAEVLGQIEVAKAERGELAAADPRVVLLGGRPTGRPMDPDSIDRRRRVRRPNEVLTTERNLSTLDR